MNKIEVGNSEVIAVLSAFEKLVVLTGYNLQKGDVDILHKVILVIDEQKLPMVRKFYESVFTQLDELRVPNDKS